MRELDLGLWRQRREELMQEAQMNRLGREPRPMRRRALPGLGTQDGSLVGWVAGFAAALHQGDNRAYVNLIGDEGEERVRVVYPGKTWDRLAEIKSRYDPTNLFRLNQNIPPRPTATGMYTRTDLAPSTWRGAETSR